MDVFEEVKRELDINMVISHYGIKIEKGGKLICPFHLDHNPSASIKNDFFYCFVCGAGGDLITFTAMYLGVSNIDACRQLIKDFNLNIDIDSREEEIKAKEKEIKAKIRQQDTLRGKLEVDKEAKGRVNKLYTLRRVRQEESKEEQDRRHKDIEHARTVLAAYHGYLWQGMQLYPYGHVRHTEALQELAQCEYYLECFDSNEAEFCEKRKDVLATYDTRINRQN